MIVWESPWAFFLALPWVVFWWWLARLNRRALAFVDKNVSARFRSALTIHGRRSLEVHLFLLLLMGLLLITAAARPTVAGEGEAAAGGRVLLLIDASASMSATDLPEDVKRFEEARRIALGLVESLEGARFALVSWSGVATFHLPVTGDHDLVVQALEVLETHNIYQNTGSSFTAALDAALHFADDADPNLQVVLLSDGEQPFSEDYGDALHALAERGIPVHGVAVGTALGQGRVIYDFRDVAAGKEPDERRVLRKFTTRRVDEHLERMARETGGLFTVASAETVSELRDALASRPVKMARLGDESARADLAAVPLGAFLVFFLVDTCWIGYHRRRPDWGFNLGRITGAALVVLVLGCDSLLWRAHLENERGIAKDDEGRYAEARPHYERSRGYGVRAEVPTYNLARSVTLAGDFAEAHALYQEALELAPELAEAHYNDGITLYAWGGRERDPTGCELERTLDLWRQSVRRLETAAELTSESTPLGADARTNLAFAGWQLARLENLASSPPEDCPPPPEQDQEGGGGGGGSEPPPSGPPPPGGGEQEEVRQALERIAAQVREEGKFFRRSGAEQFGKASWENPEAEIWW